MQKYILQVVQAVGARLKNSTPTKGQTGFACIQGFTQSETLNIPETEFQAGLPKLGRGKLGLKQQIPLYFQINWLL